LYQTNLRETSGFDTKTTNRTKATGIVATDGKVTLVGNDGGLYIYSIEVGAVPTSIPGETTDVYEDNISHNVSQDFNTNQMQVSLDNNNILYYNTTQLKSVDVDKEKSIVTITTNNDEKDVFYGSVRNLSFAKSLVDIPEGEINNYGVEITEARGWYESAYIKWNLNEAAKSYNVYVKGGKYSDYTKIDEQLVRNYGTYGRADAVGLISGTYSMKVVAVDENGDEMRGYGEATDMDVINYQREGFAFFNHPEGVGAYNNDGSLKQGAKVLYITAKTAKTVTCDVKTSSSGATTTSVGLQTILDNYLKGYDSTPIAFRFIGTIKKSDLDHISSSAEGLQVKSNKDNEMNLTFEGIGDDATIKDFGFLLHSARSVELRNFAIMMYMDDAISLDTKNKNVWVHHMDLFYGQPGSDDDQNKGDGTIDVKKNSQYITMSYNHLWDSGKASLCGMDNESGPNYISYDHNWFDHSDSRHPRVRTMSVHVWNNYYDGISKYGVGSTTGSSVFVEGNYFRNCKFPMLISMQGNDMYAGTGNYNASNSTFSDEDGGIIKSFGNVITGSTSSYWPYNASSLLTKGNMVSASSLNIDTKKHFDAYEVSNRNEQVPATVKAFQGGGSYNNFDTNASLMYSYTADAAADVPAKVVGWYGAGRLNHGDFKWTFDNSTEDTNYGVIEELKTALINYESSLVGIFGDENSSSGEQGGGEQGGGEQGGEQGDVIECNFSDKAPSNSFFTVTNGNYSTSKGSVTIDGTTYSTCLKMESKTEVSFTSTEATTLMLAFSGTDNQNIKIDGTKVTDATEVGDHWEITYDLPAAEHVLTKGDTSNLFFIRLTKKGE
jgi:pectate lyase